MTNSEIEVGERILAHGLSLRSRVAEHFPRIRDYLIGCEHPSYVAARWRYDGIQKSSIPYMARFEGIPGSSYASRSYADIGIMGIRTRELNQMRTAYPTGRLAVAYVLRQEAMLVGVLAEDTRFSRQGNFSLFAMGISNRSLEATAGWFVEETGALMTSDSPIRKIDRLPISSVPDEIIII